MEKLIRMTCAIRITGFTYPPTGNQLKFLEVRARQ